MSKNRHIYVHGFEKSKYATLKARDRPYYELAVAIKKKAFYDLAANYNEIAGVDSLIDFCKHFLVEDEAKNDILLEKACERRFNKMYADLVKKLDRVIKKLDEVEERINTMKYNLKDMIDDMLKDDAAINPEPVNSANPDADKIEETLEEAPTPTPTPAPTPTPTPTPAQTPTPTQTPTPAPEENN